MRRRLICTVLILSLPLTASGTVIDDFSVGDYTLGQEGLPMPYTVSGTSVDGSGLHIIGTERHVTFEKRSGSVTQPYVANSTGWGSSYNSAFGCSGVWTMAYGTSQPLHADLSLNNSDAIILEMSGDLDDSSPVRPVPVTVTVSSATGTASLTIDMIDDGLYFFEYADFPGVDFSDVLSLEFRFEQDGVVNDAVDFAIFYLMTDNMQSVSREQMSWGETKLLFR